MLAHTRPLTGRKVLVIVLGFFAVVIAANVTLTTFAIRTLPGTEVESSYQEGNRYNDEIAAARSQEARRWQVIGHVERAPDGHATLQIEARDASGTPATGLVFSAQLARPIDKRADRKLALAEREAGVYRGEVDQVAAGQWDLVIEAERAGARLFLSKNRVVLK